MYLYSPYIHVSKSKTVNLDICCHKIYKYIFALRFRLLGYLVYVDEQI